LAACNFRGSDTLWLKRTGEFRHKPSLSLCVFRPQAGYRRSLEVLRIARELRPAMPTKSGLMVGLGETRSEIHKALADLRAVRCDLLTMFRIFTSPAS